jgi:hypothetical protein
MTNRFIAAAGMCMGLVLAAAGTSPAATADIINRRISPAKNETLFPNSKGEVVFSHTKHLNGLKEDQCILCHRTDKPTLENIQSRFENHRVAHNFCKGCHREIGKGPTECHQCHNYRKTT